MRITAIVCFLVFITAATAPAQTAATLTADQLLQRGEQSYHAGNFTAAVDDLRAASAALLSPEQKQQYIETGKLRTLPQLEESLVYLALAFNKLGKDAEARDAVTRLLNAERIVPTYSTLPLPGDAAEFEPLVARLVPSASLTPNVQLALRGGPAQVAAAAPAPAPAAGSTQAAPASPAPAQTTAPPPRTATATVPASAIPVSPASTTTTTASTPSGSTPVTGVASTPSAPAPPASSVAVAPPPPPATPVQIAQAQPAPPAPAQPAEPALTAEERAEMLRLVDERVAEARAQIEREANEKIAAIQREADARVAREHEAARQQIAAAQKAADERIAAEQSAARRVAPTQVITPQPPPQPVQPAVQRVVQGDLLARLRDADSFASTGRIDEASRLYAAIAASPNASREAISAAAIGLYRTGSFAEAVAAFRRLGTIGRGEEDLRYYEAVSLYETGHYQEARRELICALPYIQATDDVTRYQAKIELSAEQQLR